MYCLAISTTSVFSIFIGIIAVFVALIVLATAEQKLLREREAEQKEAVVGDLNGEHVSGVFKSSFFLAGFRLLKTHSSIHDISSVQSVIQGNDVMTYIGDYSYATGEDEESRQTVFLVVVSDFRFDDQIIRHNPLPIWIRKFFGWGTAHAPAFPNEEINELIQRRKWTVETKGQRCLIYRRNRVHSAKDYQPILLETEQLVSALMTKTIPT